MFVAGEISAVSDQSRHPEVNHGRVLEHPARRTPIFGLTISAFELPLHGAARESERGVREPLPICGEAG